MMESLRWLARHQSADGHWDSAGFSAACGRGGGGACDGKGVADFDIGVTGLALEAFIGCGYSQYSDDAFDGIRYGDVIKKGLQWLMSRQGADGGIGEKGTATSMINHAIAALALTDAYDLTCSEKLKGPALKAIGFIVQAQSPGKGWTNAARGDINLLSGWGPY